MRHDVVALRIERPAQSSRTENRVLVRWILFAMMLLVKFNAAPLWLYTPPPTPEPDLSELAVLPAIVTLNRLVVPPFAYKPPPSSALLLSEMVLLTTLSHRSPVSTM